MAQKTKYPLKEARIVAMQLCTWLQDTCEQIHIVGSVRREKAWVGDVEILLVPKKDTRPAPGELFPKIQNLVQLRLLQLRADGFLELRTKKDGTVADGEQVKLLRHCATQIPVDIFLVQAAHWFSALVCRTGGKENNARIATLAKKVGWRWQMNGPGFLNLSTGEIVQVSSEEEVFSFVGLPYLAPQQRS